MSAESRASKLGLIYQEGGATFATHFSFAADLYGETMTLDEARELAASLLVLLDMNNVHLRPGALGQGAEFIELVRTIAGEP